MRRRYSYVMRRLDEDILVSFFKIGMSVDPPRRAKQLGAELVAMFYRFGAVGPHTADCSRRSVA